MSQINANKIVTILSDYFGINLYIFSNLQEIEVRPSDLEFGEGFTLKIKAEWRKLTAEFIPDNFAGTLIRTMGLANSIQKEIFQMLLTKYSTTYNEVYMEINEIPVSPLESLYWAGNWNNLNIKLLKFPIIKDELSPEEFEDSIINITSDLLGLVLSLLPLEENINDENIVGLPEGAVTRVEVNRYERSSFNRQACLRIHGSICKVCEFDFEKRYGLIGKGFIHVHHVIPVSKIGPSYQVNLKTDLIPVCPNCHAMIHKRTPPYTIEELKSNIESNIEVRKGS